MGLVQKVYIKQEIVHLTIFAAILCRQVTSQRRTWFTKSAQIYSSLASLQSVAVSCNNTYSKPSKRQ